jgi:alternate signal-mediated exported protein
MNKTTKGMLAAAAGGVLLLGGAGSLAYWNATVTVTGSPTINSGKLTLSEPVPGTCAAAPWTLDSVGGGGTFNPTTDYLVPGDVLTKHCSYTIGAQGNHLLANITTTGGAASGTLAPALTVAGTYTVAGAPATSITSASDGKTLDATISVTFIGSSLNPTQQKTAALSDFVVTLQQAHG